MPKRTYTRRSDTERIEELEAKLAKVKARLAERKLRDSALHRETKKVERVLRRFAQTAMDEGREDITNSTLAFLAGLKDDLEFHAAFPPWRACLHFILAQFPARRARIHSVNSGSIFLGMIPASWARRRRVRTASRPRLP